MSYTEEVYERVVAQNPGEPEFHQAVKEVLDSLKVVIERNEEEYHHSYKAGHDADIAEYPLAPPSALISGLVFHLNTTSQNVFCSEFFCLTSITSFSVDKCPENPQKTKVRHIFLF